MANAPRSDPFTNFQSEDFLATVRDMVDDSELLTEITLKSLTSQSTDIETGKNTRTSDDDTVNALRRLVSAAEAEWSGGQLEPNDRVYLVDQADLTKDELQTVDRIVEGTDVLGVIRFSADPLKWMWMIIARIL